MIETDKKKLIQHRVMIAVVEVHLGLQRPEKTEVGAGFTKDIAIQQKLENK